MAAEHLQRLSLPILERLRLYLCEVLTWLNRQHLTFVHIVTFDSNAKSRDLLKMLTVSGALVFKSGSKLSSPASTRQLIEAMLGISHRTVLVQALFWSASWSAQTFSRKHSSNSFRNTQNRRYTCCASSVECLHCDEQLVSFV